MADMYDVDQFRKDCWQILCNYGERKPYGFFTIQEYTCGPLTITTRINLERHQKGMAILFHGNPIKTVKMGTPLADHIMKLALQIEERQKITC